MSNDSNRVVRHHEPAPRHRSIKNGCGHMQSRTRKFRRRSANPRQRDKYPRTGDSRRGHSDDQSAKFPRPVHDVARLGGKNRGDETMRTAHIIVGALILFSPVGAMAQSGSYVIQRPGQVPTNVNRTPGGGYIMQTPGQPPTNVTLMPGGGYRTQTPGR